MALPSVDALLLSNIRRQTELILEDVVGSTPREVVLLDTPRHRNLGDSLIWRGTLDYLHGLGHRFIYQSDWGRHRDDDLRKLSDNTVILLQGGGNFGDLYPLHDEFRRHIISTFPKRRIVLLPQTVFYTSPTAARAALRQYRQGENLTVLLRERTSIRFAEEAMAGMDVRFCYDLALGAQIEQEVTSGGEGVLVLARDDGEQATLSDVEVRPWADWDFRPLNQLAYKAATGVGAAYKRFPTRVQDALYGPAQRANSMILDLNIAAAIAQFRNKDAVATDRLHAHVLSLLLGIPHAVTDNSYGKISSIFGEYTGMFSSAHWANSLSEAVDASHVLAAVGAEAAKKG
ncbi:polysaccharide pyruvyl transferase family protein [Kocuria arenosa]|uniref:polysaccharide pyruvyl transferase family protein n=1 Tax=Kocuria arenosa TaxID=3071446 RepID=UPI0034D52F10